eukprot:GHVO01050297.1.p1 GENE.GHVO01050297.1~~GHVO01050297.1.p1  ORF type:complete len:341 (+),score=60.19 GHVO01050297.1:478-1500(+)
MLQGGLSSSLIEAFANIVKSLNALLPLVRHRLKALVTYTIINYPGLSVNEVNEAIHLALKALTIFGVPEDQREFTADCVLKYLDHDSPQIRMEAVSTVCRLAFPIPLADTPKAQSTCKGNEVGVSPHVTDTPIYEVDIHRFELSPKNISFLCMILRQLISHALSDDVVENRTYIIGAIDSRFDIVLADTYCVSCLLQCLNDECLDVRKAAMRLLTRVENKNTVIISAGLSQCLLQCLTEIDFSYDVRVRGDAADMIYEYFSVRKFLDGNLSVRVLIKIVNRLKEALGLAPPTLFTNTDVSAEEGLSYLISLARAVGCVYRHSICPPPSSSRFYNCWSYAY